MYRIQFFGIQLEPDIVGCQMRYNPTDAGTGQCDIRYVQKTFTFSFFEQLKNKPILIILVCYALRKFDMNILHLCPRHLSGVATSPSEIQKVSFQQYYSYFRLFSLSQNKTNCNCCTTA